MANDHISLFGLVSPIFNQGTKGYWAVGTGFLASGQQSGLTMFGDVANNLLQSESGGASANVAEQASGALDTVLTAPGLENGYILIALCIYIYSHVYIYTYIYIFICACVCICIIYNSTPTFRNTSTEVSKIGKL